MNTLFQQVSLGALIILFLLCNQTIAAKELNLTAESDKIMLGSGGNLSYCREQNGRISVETAQQLLS